MTIATCESTDVKCSVTINCDVT